MSNYYLPQLCMAMSEFGPEDLPPVETKVDGATLKAGLAESGIAAQIKKELDAARATMEQGNN